MVVDELEQRLAVSKQRVLAHQLTLPQTPVTMHKVVRHRRRRRLAVWGTVAAGALLTSGFAMPTLIHIGKHFNLLKSQQLSPNDVRNSVLLGYGQKVNQSVTSNGITLTIGNIYADPLKFEFDMVESFTKQAKSHPVIADQDMHLDINGKKQIDGFSGGDFERANGHRYAGIVYMPMVNMTPFQPLPVNFSLNIHVSQIGNVKGNWNFSIPVSQLKMANATKVLQPHLVKSNGKLRFAVNEVSIGPNQTIIQSDLTRLNSSAPEYRGNGVGGISRIVVVTYQNNDSLNGRILGMPASSNSDGHKVYHLTLSAQRLSKTAQELHVTPLVQEHTVQAAMTGKFPLTLNTPTSPVQVTGIDFLKTKTVAHLVMDDDTYEKQQMQQFILTYPVSAGTMAMPMKKIVITDAAKHEYTAEFPKLNPKNHYTLQIQSFKPLTSLAVTVPTR